MISARRAPLVIATAALVVLSTGCRPERPPAELVVVVDSPVRSLDPRLAVDSASARLSRLVFEGLTEIDEAGLPRLALAKSIVAGERRDSNGRPLAYRVTLHRGV